MLEFGGDEHFPTLAARHLTVFVGHESTDELDVSRNDADLKVGFESDFGHVKKNEQESNSFCNGKSRT